MSGHLNQYYIRELLCIVYGESWNLRYLMRRENRLKQLVIARELMFHSHISFTPIQDRSRATLFTAILACIEEELAEHSARDIEIAKFALQGSGINPPDLPDFITNLFSLDE